MLLSVKSSNTYKAVMTRSPLLLALTAVLLSACSPAAQQEGFMRILGDLRWDKLTSAEEWMNRFPECLTDKRLSDNTLFDHALYKEHKCHHFNVGGISIFPSAVYFDQNKSTSSKTMTRWVTFSFIDDSQSRAFKSAIARKYQLATPQYCSRYTCYELGTIHEASSIHAKPTPYTVSILDNVKVDDSDI